MTKSLKTKLRIRFVLLAMLCLLAIQSVIIGMVIFQNHRDLVTKSDLLISQLHHDPSGSSRYFSVKIPAGKTAVYPDVVQHVSVTVEEATQLTQCVLEKGQEKGFIDGYRYHIYQNESGTRIYFLYRGSSLEMCKTATENMILVSLISFVVIGAVLIPVSAWVVKPLVDNHKKQKEFITAAGHQLKTPLTVISTNAQLLETEIGQNTWLDGIVKQITHMTRMTHDLVALSKVEEYDNPVLRERFSFSEALEDVAATYHVIAKQKGLCLEHEIPEELLYVGSKTEVQQLLGILLDNACKYCPVDGVIRIKAKKCFQGVRLVVFNTAEPMPEIQTNMLVRRFYRGQNATEKSGFGLGLSIAEAIALRHNGNLTVSTAVVGEFLVEVVLR